MLLQEILLQHGVRLVIVWMSDCVETQLDDLLAEGGDGVVESVPLVHHPLGSEAGLHLGEPPGSVVCPEQRQRYPLVVCRRHCRVKNEVKRRAASPCVSSKSGSPLLRRSGRAVCLYCTAHKTQLTIYKLEDFLPATLIPDLLTPNPLADLLIISSNVTIKLRCLHSLFLFANSSQTNSQWPAE
jgi:hypothetical protein